MQFQHQALSSIAKAVQTRPDSSVPALFFGNGEAAYEAAAELAKALRLPLRRVDLGAMVTKYIGDTEKNLDRVFAEASRAGAALFFDEADALFGERTEVKDANDRYANLETVALLDRMERFKGLAILATNLRDQSDVIRRRLRHFVELP